MLVHGDGYLSIILFENPGGMIGAAGFQVMGSRFSPISIWCDASSNPHYQISWPLGWESSKYTNSLSIAHWFLILHFAIIWITWMVRRARRFKRLAAEFELGGAGSHPPP